MTAVAAVKLDGSHVSLNETDIDSFRKRLKGQLMLPGEDGYDAGRKLWNGMIERKPALVARPIGTADVIECVNFARTNGILISVKGGGHNIAGTGVCDGGLCLDMSLMKGVFVDTVNRVAHVQPGCLLGDVDRETQIHGLATTLGFVSETGVAGLTLGGGFGYLTRRFGYTVDSLQEVELVTEGGKVIKANRDSSEDLFWALRGGGGNFGVVTSFTYRLYPVGPSMTGGMIGWPIDRVEKVLEHYRKLTSSAPRELTLVVSLRFGPSAPFVPAEWRGKPVAVIIACHTGSPDSAKDDIARLRKLEGSIFDTIAERSYIQQQTMFDGTQPSGVHYYWKSEYFSELSDDALAAMIESAKHETSPFSQVVLFHIAGAIGEKQADDGAVGNRDAGYVMSLINGWQPADGEAQRHTKWVRDSWQNLRPFSTGGTYINFQTSDEGDERVRASYGSNFERLAAVKAKYDPSNMFRTNKNIAPSATRGRA